MRTTISKIRAWFRAETNRRWLYGVIEAALWAAVGFGVIDGETAMVALTVPAAALGLARRNVRNPE